MEEKKSTLDEMIKSVVTDAARANQPTSEINHEVVSMLFGIYQQGQERADVDQDIRALLHRLVDKEAVKVTTQEVKFPAVMEVEEVSPIKEVEVKKPSWFQFPPIKSYFDALSTENAKGQFAIIDTLVEILDFLKKIDLTKLQKNTDGYGGVLTPRWHIETPDGAIDSSNKVFTLTMTPKTNSLFMFLGGMLQTENEDYTINRNVITYINAPAEGVTPHVARYQV